jgi:DNA-binding response OmpR family regulator
LQLERAGCRTNTAASAKDTLALVRRDQPDLILLEVGLPGMDGLAALRHFWQDSAVPIRFVTARRRELDTILGLELVLMVISTMPFNPDVLLAQYLICAAPQCAPNR